MFSFLSNVGSYLIFLISNYFMALKFGPEVLGEWVFINSAINLGFMFIAVGIDQIHYQYSVKKSLSNIFGAYLFIKVLLLTSNVAITLIIISILNLWNSPYILLLLLLLFSKTIFQFGNIFILNFKSNMKIFKAEIPMIFSYFSKSIIKIYIALNISSIPAPLLYICISYFIFDIIYLIIIFLFSKKEFKINKPEKQVILNYLKDARPLIIQSIFSVIATNIGNLLLAFSFGHEYLSYFSLVHVYLIPSLIMITRSLYNVYLALFSRYYENNDLKSIKDTIYLIEKYSSILFLFIILVVFLNGRYLFLLLLPNYIDSVPILYIMIFIPFIYGTTRPYFSQLISGKKQGKYAQISIITNFLIIFSIFLSVFVNFILYQKALLDILGYTLSTTLPWILWAVLSRWYCKKYYDIKTKNTIFSHLLISFLIFLISFSFKEYILSFFFQSLFIINLISFLLILGLFFGFLFLFKQLKKEDVKFILQLLNYKNYLKSMREEFSSE